MNYSEVWIIFTCLISIGLMLIFCQEFSVSFFCHWKLESNTINLGNLSIIWPKKYRKLSLSSLCLSKKNFHGHFFSVFLRIRNSNNLEYWDTNNSNIRIVPKNELPEVRISELPAKRNIMNPTPCPFQKTVNLVNP